LYTIFRNISSFFDEREKYRTNGHKNPHSEPFSGKNTLFFGQRVPFAVQFWGNGTAVRAAGAFRILS
jgi:hypothetical protein